MNKAQRLILKAYKSTYGDPKDMLKAFLELNEYYLNKKETIRVISGGKGK